MHLILNMPLDLVCLTAFSGHIKPHFDNRCKLFELDPCDGHGKVCLVYKDIKAGMSKSNIVNL